MLCVPATGFSITPARSFYLFNYMTLLRVLMRPSYHQLAVHNFTAVQTVTYDESYLDAGNANSQNVSVKYPAQLLIIMIMYTICIIIFKDTFCSRDFYHF